MQIPKVLNFILTGLESLASVESLEVMKLEQKVASLVVAGR